MPDDFRSESQNRSKDDSVLLASYIAATAFYYTTAIAAVISVINKSNPTPTTDKVFYGALAGTILSIGCAYARWRHLKTQESSDELKQRLLPTEQAGNDTSNTGYQIREIPNRGRAETYPPYDLRPTIYVARDDNPASGIASARPEDYSDDDSQGCNIENTGGYDGRRRAPPSWVYDYNGKPRKPMPKRTRSITYPGAEAPQHVSGGVQEQNPVFTSSSDTSSQNVRSVPRFN